MTESSPETLVLSKQRKLAAVIGAFITFLLLALLSGILLDYIKPDLVHVMVDGKIVRTGGPELALELEKQGYADWKIPG